MRKLALVTLIATLAACAGPEQAPPAESAPEVTAQAQVHEAVTLTPERQEGKVTFEGVCWTCHGDGPAAANLVAKPFWER